MKNTMAPYLVLPVPDELSQPFWDAAKQVKLVIQRCQQCRFYLHPPAFLGTKCRNREAALVFERVSGRGSVYSHYIHYDKEIAGFEDKVPYPVVLVELKEQEGLFMATNILHCAYDEIIMGLPVEVVFEVANDDISIPQFRPRK